MNGARLRDAKKCKSLMLLSKFSSLWPNAVFGSFTFLARGSQMARCNGEAKMFVAATESRNHKMQRGSL